MSQTLTVQEQANVLLKSAIMAAAAEDRVARKAAESSAAGQPRPTRQTEFKERGLRALYSWMSQLSPGLTGSEFKREVEGFVARLAQQNAGIQYTEVWNWCNRHGYVTALTAGQEAMLKRVYQLDNRTTKMLKSKATLADLEASERRNERINNRLANKANTSMALPIDTSRIWQLEREVAALNVDNAALRAEIGRPLNEYTTDSVITVASKWVSEMERRNVPGQPVCVDPLSARDANIYQLRCLKLRKRLEIMVDSNGYGTKAKLRCIDDWLVELYEYLCFVVHSSWDSTGDMAWIHTAGLMVAHKGG